MSDYFSLRNQNFLKYSSSTHQQETENFSISLRKKKRTEAQNSFRINTLNNFLNLSARDSPSCQETSFAFKQTAKANNSIDENLIIEQVFFDSVLESKLEPFTNFISFEYLEKIVSDSVFSSFSNPETILNLLEMISKDSKGKILKKNPDLFLNLILKLVKTANSEEIFIKTLKILSIFLNSSRKISESLKKTEDFEDFFIFFKRSLTRKAQLAVVETLKSFSNNEEILNDFEVSAFFDSFSRILKICDLKVKKKCFAVLAKIIQGHEWSSEIFVGHALFNDVMTAGNEESLLRNYCKIVSVCSCGSNRHVQKLLDSDILSNFSMVFQKKQLKAARNVYFTLANLVAGTSDQFSQLLAHPVFDESLKTLIDLDVECKIEASFYIRNLMKLTSEFIKIQILQSSLGESVKELLMIPDPSAILNYLTVVEEILKIFGREYFIQKKFEPIIEVLLTSNSWEVNQRVSQILYPNY